MLILLCIHKHCIFFSIVSKAKEIRLKYEIRLRFLAEIKNKRYTFTIFPPFEP